MRAMDVANSMENVKGVGFIGAGNMAQAIGCAFVNAGLFPAQKIFVSSPTDRNKKIWNDMGANTTTNNGYVVEKCDIIFLAMKPVYLDTALIEMKNTLNVPDSNKLFVSLLGGVPLKSIEKKIHGILPDARVIRVMPNTPIQVGAGCSVFSCSSTATRTDAEIVKKMLSVGGICEEMSESLIDAVGGLAGSGPAYVYLVIEALSDGAVKMGVPRHIATQFAAQTVLGAGKMVLETGKHPGQLKDEVCSPGGSTICGIHVMEKGGVRCSLMNAVEAATNKSKEVSRNN